MGNRTPQLTSQTLKVLVALMAGDALELSGAQIAGTTKLASGTLYPILIRLEEARFVESRWETEDPHELGRPRRRFYRITGIGARRAKGAIRNIVSPIGDLAWH
jgi:PadR family transcriptional regulator PadR